MYNLHNVKNPKTLLIFLLNVCSLVTSIFDLVLDLKNITTTPTTTSVAVRLFAHNSLSCINLY